ncbi:MAG: DUF2167 domain-containing protein [Polyangiaceae bacterium]
MTKGQTRAGSGGGRDAKWRHGIGLAAFGVATSCWLGIAGAAPSAGPSDAPSAVQPEAAASAGSTESQDGPAIPWQAGPKTIDLGHDLVLDLTDRYAFLERDPAAKLLEKNGSIYNEDLLGLVIGTQPEDDWFVVIRYDAEGFIKDDEAIDADDLLEIHS